MCQGREGPCREGSDQRTRGKKQDREGHGRQSGALKDLKLKSKAMEITAKGNIQDWHGEERLDVERKGKGDRGIPMNSRDGVQKKAAMDRSRLEWVKVAVNEQCVRELQRRGSE